ncbi:MAG: Sugar kinase, ribokinase family [Clostridiales bacterium]|jgi:fructokinase|nr:Sugar kinase, ribokinase family [Clostridiales bacterium]
MNKRYDVTALGELLIDFTQNGLSEQGNILFEANPGGAPCNVLAMLTKLGKTTAFIGKVGKDQFGIKLKEALVEVGIATDNLILDSNYSTTLAFIHTFEDGDRDFSFYRNPGADMMLTSDEIKEDIIKDSRIFHFGTLSMTHEGVREATKRAIKIAKDNNLLITFDPNLRKPLWKDLELAKEQILYGLSQCDVVKMSEEELEFVTGQVDIDKGVALLREQYNILLILITMGKEGSRAYYQDEVVDSPGFITSDTIETTGAGDTFCANIIGYILDHDIHSLTKIQLKEMLTFANAAASLITTKKGALRVMPEKCEIEDYIKTYGR